jgi:excisionase family DNA binding protein
MQPRQPLAQGERLLSPRELADAIGVSQSSLKRWVDDGLVKAARTAGNHRRIALAEAIRFIRHQRTPLLRPHLLGLEDLRSVAGMSPAGARGEQLFELLARGRQEQARGLILSWFVEGDTIAEIADGPLQAAMERIGELWQHDPQGIFVEHRATDICLQAVNQLRILLPVAEHAPSAVGGALSGDPYLLPSLIAACVLAENGFNAVNLGPHMPPRSLVQAAMHYSARACWLSMSSQVDARVAVQWVHELKEQLHRVGAVLIVGGRESGCVAHMLDGNLLIADSMAALVAAVRPIR